MIEPDLRDDRQAPWRTSLLVLEHDAEELSRLTGGARRQGARVFPAQTGKAALEILREHNGNIACLVTNASILGPISGRLAAFWFRFYNPFGPVLYISDDAAPDFDQIEHSDVLSPHAGVDEIMDAALRIQHKIDQIFLLETLCFGCGY